MAGRLARLAGRLRGAPPPDEALRALARELRASGLFGPPDAAGPEADDDPLVEALRHGAGGDPCPHPLFDAAYYLRRHPEVRAAGWPALLHYLREGEARGLRPNPLFDPAWYASRHSEVSAGGGRLLAHYAREGAREGAAPGPLFDPAWYARTVPGGVPPGADPLAHWLAVGRARGADPHPLFDGTWYLTQLPSASARGLDPVSHWVETGAAAGLSPHPLLDAAWYVSRHPEASADPLRHWIEVGAAQGLAPHPLFDAAWYRARHPQVGIRGLDPLRHYLEEGAARGLPTHPLFDPAWYRLRHPELEGPIAALVHCAEQRGAAGGEPSPLFARFARFFLPDDELPWLGGPHNPLAWFLSGAARLGPPPRLAFLEHPAPEASIIVPAWGRETYTVACLRSLAAARGETPFEVVLVDDASPEVDYRELLGFVPGLRILRNDANLGFVGSCNRGAAAARGRWLVFLNNDTVACDGWLDALLATFDAFHGAGVAGSKLLYPSGRTGEAGAIVWRDGSCWNYGRRHPPDGPEVGYAREVDYVSGAALAVERSLFESLGGFDEAFAPGYYEDVDLAFRVRAAGRRVVYQPCSEVIHFEGVSAGLDPGAGMKAGQVRNRRAFLDRWGDSIRDHAEAAPEALDREKDRATCGEALVIDTVAPTPGRDSRSLRLLHLLRILRELGLRPSFLPANGHAPAPWRATLESHGVRVLTPPGAPSPEAFLDGTRESFDVCMVCRPALAARLLPVVRARWPRARTVFDAADLLPAPALAALREGGEPKGPLGRAARAAAALADVTLVAANPEDWKPDDGAGPALLSWIYDTRTTPAPRAARRDLLFVPGLQPAPAVDALLWLRDELLPRLAAELGPLRVAVPAWPALRPLLVGDERLLPLSDAALEAPRAFDGYRVALSPLRFGGPVAGRLQPALAAGLPCVASPSAARGLPARVRDALAIAADGTGLVREIARLYRDDAAWERATAEGRAAIGALFGFERARERMRTLLQVGSS